MNYKIPKDYQTLIIPIPIIIMNQIIQAYILVEVKQE
jgi:hypothetical protein